MLVRPFVIALTVVTEAVACGRNYEDTIRQGVRPSDRSQNDHARRIYREQVATQAATGLSSATHRGEAQGVLKRSNVVSVRSFGRRVSNVRRNGRIGWRESLALRWTRGGCSSRKTANGIAQRHEGAANGRSVLLYYPNLIGYARVALVLTSYYLAETRWKASSSIYLMAFAGDAVDGYVARKFGQVSRFGSVLDMVTDRCSTAGLLLVLSRLYSRAHAFAFLVLIYVDLFSHWMHTHSVLGQPHKSTSTLRRRSFLIRAYYENLALFSFCCIGAELFYALLYLLHFWPRESPYFDPLRRACYWVCLPACVLKQVVNVAQMFSAARALASEGLEPQR